ncbi:putative phage abortive infection protein [Klebsiella sp. C239]|uniref:putative phage abortive infection protein n=1 Tax=Klebsiella sp. C239 TaxID=3409929 RepID=UPI003B596818
MLFLLVVFLVLLGVLWHWFQNNITLISGLATALAFFATAWAAHEGRKSARAAFRAVKTSEDALEETRKNYLRDAFNQRFSLLLEQHNTYLEKVNNYVLTESGWLFIKEKFYSTNHFEAFNAMSGHVILSPYMRILYHTLRFVDQDYFGEKNDIKGKKKYTSLIRSLISNDVLFLVAVNSSYVSNEGNKNQYYKYQYLLQRFDFFEHANFININHQNETSKNFALTTPILNIEGDIKNTFYNYISDGNHDATSNFRINMYIPAIVAYIYKNPLQGTMRTWLDKAPSFLFHTFIENTDKRSYEDIFNMYLFEKFSNCYIDKAIYNTNILYNAESKRKLDKEILKSIIRAVRGERLQSYSLDSIKFVKLKNNSSHVSTCYNFETLYYDIINYKKHIDRKNYISFGKRYLPVKDMATKFRKFESELKKQCALTYID